MAGNSRPSFLKRQKEQKRLERANAKRAVRQARRDAKLAGTGENVPGEDEVDVNVEAPEAGDEAAGEPGADETR